MMTNKFSPASIEISEIRNPETILSWGKTLVFAPHPDDESLGCGGTIALLRKYDLDVAVIVLSDGTLSHPNSVKFPPEKLRDLREREMKNALEILGVSENYLTFLRYRDRSVPQENSPDFEGAVEKIKTILAKFNPQTILLPWRRDPHPDHRATWQIVNAAISAFENKIRRLEYPIWLWEIAEETDFPVADEVNLWRLNVSETVAQKQTAINAHLSQTTDLIDDDPHGFRLSPEVLQHFDTPFEIYLEEKKIEK